jgi:hypothetical protein
VSELGKSPENITFSELKTTLPVRVWWGIAGATLAVVVGAASLGAWLQSGRDQSVIVSQETNESQLQGKLNDANGKIQAMVGVINEASARDRAISSKAEFLDRFLAYRNAPGEESRIAFAGYVCALWKNSEEHQVHVDAAPIQLTADSIQSGLSPELKSFLISKGVSETFFEHAERGTTTLVQPFAVTRPVVSPTQAEAIATIQKFAQSAHLVKIVHFYDGTNYQVPDEIAYAVHTDPKCAPN